MHCLNADTDSGLPLLYKIHPVIKVPIRKENCIDIEYY